MAAQKSKIRSDILLAAGIIAAALIIFLIFSLLQTEGNYAVVSVNGKITAKYPLSEDKEIDIHTGRNNENLNVLVIKNGKAYIKKADCPDKICTRYRPVSKAGETIVCLPHRLVISIESAEDS